MGDFVFQMCAKFPAQFYQPALVWIGFSFLWRFLRNSRNEEASDGLLLGCMKKTISSSG